MYSTNLFVKYTCKTIVPSYVLLGFRVIGVITMPASTHIMFGYSSSPKSLIVFDVTSHGFHTTRNKHYKYMGRTFKNINYSCMYLYLACYI